MTSINAINIIHISDLHFGLSHQYWMWPAFKDIFVNDLEKIHKKVGSIDLVIFSGDLTQSSNPNEFIRLSSELKSLWDKFKSWGSNPVLFCTPGNHDLSRPNDIDPCALVFKNWWSHEKVRNEFWSANQSLYKENIDKYFSNYTEWLDRLEESTGINLISRTNGFLPGDSSGVYEKNGLKIGLVGLNSAWLQIDAQVGEGSLSIHPKQLLSVVDGAPDEWCSRNNINIIVTHHPVTWLHQESIKTWKSEIYTNKRFDAHLFGHMHISTAIQTSISGGDSKLSIQAPSLFGLEKINSSLERLHGYTVLSFIHQNNYGFFRVWPRIASIINNGERKIIPDYNWDLNDENFCDINISSKISLLNCDEGQNIKLETPNTAAILKALGKSSNYIEAYNAVRKTEQAYTLASLTQNRFVWIVADWGLGGDEFLEVIQHKLFGKKQDIFYIDANNYKNKDDLLSGLRDILGCSFEELCKQIAENGQCILVLDDIPIQSSRNINLEREYIELVESVLDFCEDVKIVLRSRLRPFNDLVSIVEISPLDEPDTLAYVSGHNFGGSKFITPSIIERIYRHSDGIPSRIDNLLKNISLVGLDSLHDLDSDIVGKKALLNDAAPPALAKTLNELAEMEDDLSRRAFLLLKVLSLFPQGERFKRIQRFNNKKPFWLMHVELLTNLSLISISNFAPVDESTSNIDHGSYISLRRPVREFITELMTNQERKNYNERALSLYFGEQWKTRGASASSELKFNRKDCNSVEISNGCTLVLREVVSAIESSNRQDILNALNLATSYCALLETGLHFRSMVTFYDELLPLFSPNGQLSNETSLAELQYCRASRMIGDISNAHERLSALIPLLRDNGEKQKALLNFALAKKALGHPTDEVIAIAEECERINIHSNSAIQARSIIVEHKGGENLIKNLRAVQAEAIKKNAYIVSNNISLTIEALISDTSKRKSLLEETISSSRRDGDQYNYVRSFLKHAQLTLDENSNLNTSQEKECIAVYSYLYNQRIDNLFEICHQVLWQSFERRFDHKNLLSLFRHSSLIWRLRNQTKKETLFINKLKAIIGEKTMDNIITNDKNMRYFICRSFPKPALTMGAVPPP